ncbi:tyrosinase [Pseudozyma hubeiensis SY62]|uniref:Tyrosinase n=1 Tax=Pseudozyma hubeiensis (strain SY62) TaxID=1305764 RepID=R9PI15_PSEHS|nr:tyrosinase [Pseudozyma hubeiensis SY62]GAC97740.1 tyrosinase [Pseudozyma hubeiensis SY62]
MNLLHPSLLLLCTILLAAFPILASHSSILDPASRTQHLLRCLGRNELLHADRAAVQSLLETNPNPSDDKVWSQLPPKEWGFEGHDSAGGDTWNPVEGSAQTAKDRVDRQSRKLRKCAKKLQIDVMRTREAEPQPGNGVEQGQTQVGGLPRVLPKMFGGLGFKQLGTGAGDSPLRPPQGVGRNDAQMIDPGQSAALNPGQDAAVNPGQGAALNPGPSEAGQGGSLPSLDTGVDAKPGAQDGQTLAPGLGPDEKSVAPALENDPQGVNMPKSAGADQQVGDKPALPVAVDPTSATAGAKNPAGPGGSAVDPSAAVDSNAPKAPVDPNAPVNPTAAVDPNTPNAPADPKAPTLAAAGAAALPNNAMSNTPTTFATTPSNCTHPLIRKEYSSLTRSEKLSFINAIKCVRSKPSRFHTTTPGWNAADDWTLLHIRMVKYVHFTAYFTLFHRGFTAIVERDLNLCGFPLGLPWVDWTKTSDDPSTNAVFSSDPNIGLGTDGKGDNNDCPWKTGLAVTDGALSEHFFNAPFRHRLCRQFNNLDVSSPSPHFGSNCTTFINKDFVANLGRTHDDGKFFDFSSALEISTHLSMHTCVGGNLAWLSSSPNDMVFHTHHGGVDNIFDAWQKKSVKNKDSFHGPKEQQKDGKKPAWTAKKEDVINFEPLAENVTVEELLDHESGGWGGRMCYRYDYNVEM